MSERRIVSRLPLVELARANIDPHSYLAANNVYVGQRVQELAERLREERQLKAYNKLLWALRNASLEELVPEAL